ncbi:hypothetical protein ACOZE3_30760 [Streptomyces cinereoruber]|uniref:hypothetical protein n=1 Tax=Streptomyces cinereoruber TaxID=67260 RepID=UPI003BF4C8DB
MIFLPWRRRTPSLLAPCAVGAQTAGHSLVLQNERMVSHLKAVYFTVHIDGTWSSTQPDPPSLHNPVAIARNHLRRQAAKILRQHCVLDLAAAQDDINAVLGQQSCAAPGLKTVGAARLEASPRDRELAEEHARRQQALSLEHEEELDRLAHLQHVLADPDLRRVWWIARFPDRFGELEALATALQGLPPPREAKNDGLRSDILRFTEQLVTDLHTPQQRELFLQVLIQTLQTLGHHELKDAATQWRTPPENGSTPQ